jgi:hypothetical protein
VVVRNDDSRVLHDCLPTFCGVEGFYARRKVTITREPISLLVVPT